jgi:hypothetical protein
MEQYKKSKGRAGYQYTTSVTSKYKGHYTPPEHMEGMKVAHRVFFRSKRPISSRGMSEKARAKWRGKLKTLRQVAQLFKPVKVKRVTDSSRHTVGSMPQLVAYPLNPSANDDQDGYLSSVHCEKSSSSRSNRVRKGARIVTKVLLRAGDIVLIKAARGEGEFYYLAELMEDVKKRKEKAALGKRAVRAVVYPEKPKVRWFERQSSGPTEEGDTVFTFDMSGHVNFEAIYSVVTCGNLKYGRDSGASRSSVARLQQLTISEQQHVQFRERVNASCAPTELAEACGYKERSGGSSAAVLVTAPPLAPIDGSSSSDNSRDSSDSDSEDRGKKQAEPIGLSKSRRARPITASIRLQPMQGFTDRPSKRVKR